MRSVKNRPESPLLANLNKLHREDLIAECDGKGCSDGLLSFAPTIGTLVSICFAIVIDETCTCLDRV